MTPLIERSPRSSAAPVLVVDDEPELAAAVIAALRCHGFQTSWVTTLAAAHEESARSRLVLLDLGLPDGDGLTACGSISRRAPLIVISARGDEADRVAALELGADDYVAKPFSTRELIARVHAVLRRTITGSRSIVHVDDVAIDLDAFEVRRGDNAIELTGKELGILTLLARHQGSVVRRSHLAVEVWNADLGLVQRTIDVHMSLIRAKLGPGPTGAGYIDTMNGVGYRLRR